MARVSPRPVGPLLCVALLCAALASAARADTLYWRKTAAGDLEIGPTPPPGVHAVPWDPAAPPPARPPAAPAPEPARARAKAAAPKRSAAPAPASPAADECSRHSDLAHQVADARRRVSNVEAKIERLEASDVSHSFTRCREGHYDPGCDRGSFDRDAELERAREELVQAEDALTDAEASARDTGVPRECIRD